MKKFLYINCNIKIVFVQQGNSIIMKSNYRKVINFDVMQIEVNFWERKLNRKWINNVSIMIIRIIFMYKNLYLVSLIKYKICTYLCESVLCFIKLDLLVPQLLDSPQQHLQLESLTRYRLYN